MDMLGYYADAEGIPEYINMFKEAQVKLARANLPMSNDQLITIASMAILASNHFPHATDKWEALARDRKMWTAWKAHYRAAHLARKRQLLASGTTPYSHGTVNAVTTGVDGYAPDTTFEKLDSYVDNLAAAATQSSSNCWIPHLLHSQCCRPHCRNCLSFHNLYHLGYSPSSKCQFHTSDSTPTRPNGPQWILLDAWLPRPTQPFQHNLHPTS